MKTYVSIAIVSIGQHEDLREQVVYSHSKKRLAGRPMRIGPCKSSEHKYLSKYGHSKYSPA